MPTKVPSGLRSLGSGQYGAGIGLSLKYQTCLKSRFAAFRCLSDIHPNADPLVLEF